MSYFRPVQPTQHDLFQNRSNFFNCSCLEIILNLHGAINLKSVSDIRFIRGNGTATATIICKIGTLLKVKNVSNLLFKNMMFLYSVENPGMSTSAFIVVDI